MHSFLLTSLLDRFSSLFSPCERFLSICGPISHIKLSELRFFQRRWTYLHIPVDNGFNPVWNDTCYFDILNPEVACIRFIVQDEDMFGDPNFLGQATYPVTCLKTGELNFFLASLKWPQSVTLGFEGVDNLLGKSLKGPKRIISGSAYSVKDHFWLCHCILLHKVLFLLCIC